MWSIVDLRGIIEIRKGWPAMNILIGKHEYVLDEKGRTRIPQEYRDILGENLLVAEGVGKFLTVYNEAALEEQSQIAKPYRNPQKLTDEEFDLIMFYRDAFNEAARFTPDSQKRYRIPKSMIEYAELEDDIIIAGNNTVLEIWSAKNYKRRRDKKIAMYKLVVKENDEDSEE